MPAPESRRRLEEDICIHIFTVSAGMVGVCLTVIGLIRVVIALRKADTFADDLLAIDALLFLVACLSSYWALRTRSKQRMHRVERFADVVSSRPGPHGGALRLHYLRDCHFEMKRAAERLTNDR